MTEQAQDARENQTARRDPRFLERAVLRIRTSMKEKFEVIRRQFGDLKLRHHKISRLSIDTTFDKGNRQQATGNRQQATGNRQQATTDTLNSTGKMMITELDVSIVTYNSEHWIDSFFDSLANQNYPLSRINIFAHDNSSTDGTYIKLRDISEANLFQSFSISQSENLGFGHGHNTNFQRSQSDFILACNVDLEFDKNSIKTVIDYATRDVNEVASWEFRQKPFEHPKHYDPSSLETSWSSSACILFRKSALSEVNGYDDEIFMYAEDVDLSWRLRAHGYKLRYCPDAICWHKTYENGTFKKLQFLGSTLGNLYLKARFGSEDDISNAEKNYLDLVESQQSLFDGQKEELTKNFDIYKKKFHHFHNIQNPTTYRNIGTFYGPWDYERTRSGAFYEQKASFNTYGALISIIVRTYTGRGHLLRQCLQSIKNQTYKNFEVLVVQDGGSDMSQIVTELGDARFKHVTLPKMGRCNTGNHGLSMSAGHYLNFLDDDDLFYADHLETCLSELIADKSILAVYADAFEVKTELRRNTAGEIVGIKEDPKYILFAKEFNRIDLLTVNLFPIQSVLFKRSLFESCGGLDPDLDNLEDWDLWIRYSTKTEFRRIPKTTSLFRTPLVSDQSVERQKSLNAFYNAAVEKQKTYFYEKIAVSSIRKDLRHQYAAIEQLRAREAELLDIIKHMDASHASHIKQITDNFGVERSHLMASADQHKTLVEVMRGSWSWRITYPIRFLKRLLYRRTR